VRSAGRLRSWASETTRAHTRGLDARDRGLDLPGQAAAVVTLVALVAATIEGGRSGFGAPLVLPGFALAAIAGVSFVAIEATARSPMLPLRLFRSRTFSLSTLIGLLINVCFYGLIFVFSLLFQREQHLSPLLTGLALAPIMVGITAANLGAGWIADRLGPRRTIATGAILVGAACAGLIGIDGATAYPALVAQITALGVGGGLIVPVITSEMLGSVDRSRFGVAAGTLNTMRQAGSAIGVALFGSLIAVTFISGLRLTLAICIGLTVTIGLLSALLERDRPARAGA
jgi:MFS transporter, DHA2 family, methylenomycin A resistance protein